MPVCCHPELCVGLLPLALTNLCTATNPDRTILSSIKITTLLLSLMIIPHLKKRAQTKINTLLGLK